LNSACSDEKIVNLFVLDRDPVVAARYHCDKHVPKMVLETAQMLCTARHMHGLEAPYKRAHERHPCTLWVASSLSNYLWAWFLGIALGAEYTTRFGKTHKSSAVIQFCIQGSSDMPDQGMTDFVQAMPEQYRSDDPVKAYRAYYKGEKGYFASWDRASTPDWWADASPSS